jgi:hypothetical protein
MKSYDCKIRFWGHLPYYIALNYESMWRGRLMRETLFFRFVAQDDKVLVLDNAVSAGMEG